MTLHGPFAGGDHDVPRDEFPGIIHWSEFQGETRRTLRLGGDIRAAEQDKIVLTLLLIQSMMGALVVYSPLPGDCHDHSSG
jgi:hypothetical protein